MRKQKHTVLKRIFAFTLAAAMAVGSNFSVPGTAGTVEAATTYTGTNIESQNRGYTGMGSTTKSYISKTSDGQIMVLQAMGDGKTNEVSKVVAEYYDTNYELQSTKMITIPSGYPLFGGFYEADSYYYIVYGKDVSTYVSPKDAICWQIVRYDKSWNTEKSVTLGESNTSIAFQNGNVSFAECGKYLVIRTCHSTVTKAPGKYYYDQGSTSIILDTETMEVADNSLASSSSQTEGFVRNSYAQFAKADGNTIVSAELTNQDPRGIVLVKYQVNASTGKIQSTSGTAYEIVPAFEIPKMDDYTIINTSLGGFDITDNSYILAGNSSLLVMGGEYATSLGSQYKNRDIFVALVDKATGTTTTKWLTKYTADTGYGLYSTASTPHMVKLPDGNYMILWSMTESKSKANAVYYQKIDAQGNTIGETKSVEGNLSDCVPAVIDGKLVWYTWKNDTKVFYQIDLSTMEATVINTGNILITSFSLNASFTLKPKETLTLQPTILPVNATNKEIDWSIDNTSVATIDKDGTVTAKAAGTATVTGKTTDGSEITRMCIIKVVDEESVIPIDSVKLDPTSLTIDEGTVGNIRAIITPSNATESLIWKSSNPAVATVDNTGRVTGVSAGTADITATNLKGNSIAKCVVTVKAATYPVTGVTLSKSALSLTVGESEQLTAGVVPSNATNKAVTWSSSESSVATVDASGMVNAIGAGETDITVTTVDGEKTATCKVTVSEGTVPVTDVKLNKETLSLVYGGTATLEATVLPDNATNKTVSWESSSEEVASVKNGTVTAKGPGEAVITVKTEDGGKKATCTVTVTKPYDTPDAPTAESITADSVTLKKQEGCQYSIDGKTWSENNVFSDLKPATEYKFYVKKPGDGKYYTDSGLAMATIKTADRLAESLTLDKTEVTIKEGDSSVIQLTATIEPEDVTNKVLDWSSDNEPVAVVNEEGQVTVKKAGTAKITVATTDGSELTAECTITVNAKIIPVVSVELDKDTITLTKGTKESDKLTATVTPDDATNPTLVWESSDASIAKVDAATGTVTAVSAGKATITVSAQEDSDIKAECIVEVYDKYKTPDAPVAANVTATTVTLKKVSGCEYSKDGETWQTSNEFTGLEPKTPYTFYARMAKNGYYEASDSSTGTVITTNAVAVAGVSLDVKSKKYDNLAIGKTETFTLTATVTPEEAENKTVTWTTDNSQVAEVEDGIVTVKGPGKAVITVKTADGGFTDSCTVEVYQKYAAPSAPTKKSVTASSVTLNPIAGCVYSKDGKTWQDSNVFTGLSADTTYTFYAKKSASGYYLESDASTGTEIRTDSGIVAVTGVQLNETAKTVTIKSGDILAFNLTATVSPANATNKKVTWSSSNTGVATVTASGTVSVKKGGTTVITVTTEDGGKTATCTLTVKEEPAEVPQDPTPSDPGQTGPSISDPTPTPAYVPNINVTYRTHVQSFGWQDWKQNGQMAGTSGLAKRLESINISVASAESGHKADLGVQYTTHVQSYGWMPWSANGDASGTEGEAKRLEAIKIQLTGADKDNYDIYYRVHAQSYGWLGWAKNGAPAGTAGYAKRLEGIQIVVVKKDQGFDQNMGGISSAYQQPYVALAGTSPVVGGGLTSSLDPQIGGTDAPNVTYRTHVQSYGWQGWKFNGQMSGTSGQAKRLEGIEIKLTNQPYPGDILYTTHVQSYGWQGDVKNPLTWRRNGTMAGTSGQAKRLEAICITLTGEMAEHYDIYYRVHAQSFGWLGWAKNGDPAGTAGYAKRLEGINIVLVPKNGSAPGSTVRSFVQK